MCIQTWTKVPYRLTRKTRVIGNGGEVVRMEDLVGKAVEKAYGYKDTSLTQQDDMHHHWVPKHPVELAVVEVFLRISSMTPLFVMQLRTDSHCANLPPMGVALRLEKQLNSGNESNCMLLSGISQPGGSAGCRS